MIKNLESFASWDRDTQAQCVILYHMALGLKPQAAPAPEPSPVRTKAMRRAKPYRPRPLWSDEDRIALFDEFDRGNKDFGSLARRFQRSEVAIRAQYDKSYMQFKGA